MAWVKAAAVGEIGPGGAKRLATVPPIAVFGVGGELYATADRCTHAEASLADEGYLDGAVVECGYHMARFDVRTGRVLGPPAAVPLATYRVEVDGTDVLVDIGTAAPGDLQVLHRGDDARKVPGDG